jgi:hypothetical protein
MRRRQSELMALLVVTELLGATTLLPVPLCLRRPRQTVLRSMGLTVWERLLRSFVCWLSSLEVFDLAMQVNLAGGSYGRQECLHFSLGLLRLWILDDLTGGVHSNAIRLSPRTRTCCLLYLRFRTPLLSHAYALCDGCWRSNKSSRVKGSMSERVDRRRFDACSEHGCCRSRRQDTIVEEASVSRRTLLYCCSSLAYYGFEESFD